MAYHINTKGETRQVFPKGEYFSLEEIQKYVGGYFQELRCPCFPGDGRVMLVNEEGLIKGLQANYPATQLRKLVFPDVEIDCIVGDVLVCDEFDTPNGAEYV